MGGKKVAETYDHNQLEGGGEGGKIHVAKKTYNHETLLTCLPGLPLLVEPTKVDSTLV